MSVHSQLRQQKVLDFSKEVNLRNRRLYLTNQSMMERHPLQRAQDKYTIYLQMGRQKKATIPHKNMSNPGNYPNECMQINQVPKPARHAGRRVGLGDGLGAGDSKIKVINMKLDEQEELGKQVYYKTQFLAELPMILKQRQEAMHHEVQKHFTEFPGAVQTENSSRSTGSQEAATRSRQATRQNQTASTAARYPRQRGQAPIYHPQI